MSPTRWVELTSSVGIICKTGANGGTYAQKDIAFKFASWVSVEFENLNAVFINDGIAQSERLIKLNQIAIQQMKILEDTGGRNLLK